MPELLDPPPDAAFVDDDLATFDMVDGWRVERNMGNVANTMTAVVFAAIDKLLLPEEQLGFATAEAVFRLRPGAKPRRPDVAFVAADRMALLSGPDNAIWDTVPNIAMEVISPTNTVAEIEEKLEEYFAAGVQLALVVSSRVRRVMAYRSMKNVVVHDGNDAIDLAPALPGKQLKLDDIYKRFGK